MAKKKQVEETKTSLDEFNDKLTDMSLKIKKNQKKIYIICAIVAVVVGGLLYYFMSVVPKGQARQHDAIAVADREALAGNDSIAIDIYRQVAADGKDAGNRALLDAAILLYNNGDNEGALAMVDDYSAKENIIGAAAYSLKGDCLVNLDRLDEAVAAFKDAISQSDDNADLTPIFMEKLARVYAAQGKYADQISTLEDLVSKYPLYADHQEVTARRDLELARLNGEKK